MQTPAHFHNYLLQETDVAAVRYQHKRPDMRFTELERSTALYGFQEWALQYTRDGMINTLALNNPASTCQSATMEHLWTLHATDFTTHLNKYGYKFDPYLEVMELTKNLDDPQHNRSFSRAVTYIAMGLAERATKKVNSIHGGALAEILHDPGMPVINEILYQIRSDAFAFEDVMARPRQFLGTS